LRLENLEAKDARLALERTVEKFKDQLIQNSEHIKYSLYASVEQARKIFILNEELSEKLRKSQVYTVQLEEKLSDQQSSGARIEQLTALLRYSVETRLTLRRSKQTIYE